VLISVLVAQDATTLIAPESLWRGVVNGSQDLKEKDQYIYMRGVNTSIMLTAMSAEVVANLLVKHFTSHCAQVDLFTNFLYDFAS
jgi:hypothetical protein